MATPPLSDLLEADTEDQITSTQLGLLASADPPFPVTWWGLTSVPMVMVKSFAKSLAKVAAQIAAIAKGGYRTKAEDDWLDLQVEDFYVETRKAAVYTRRKLRLTDAGGAPVTFSAARTHWVQTNAGLRYTNVDPADGIPLTLGVGGTLDLTVEAELPGSAYNGAASSWAWVTSVPGVTIADAPAGITQTGVDKESNGSYAQRAGDKWASLGAGANDAAYRFWCKKSLEGTAYDGQITRVRVDESTPSPGMVTLTVAGDQTSGTGGAPCFSSTDTNSAVTLTGTSPAMTITGTPLGNYKGKVQILSTGILGASTFKYSLDGGLTWSGAIATAATYAMSGTGLTLNFPAGTYNTGDLYDWTSTLSIITTVKNFIDPSSHLGKAPNCVDVAFGSASFKAITLGGTARYKATYPGAQAEAEANLNALAKATDIGGGASGKIRIAEIIEQVMRPNGVTDYAPATTTADVTLAGYEIPVFTFAITWVAE